MRVLVIGSNGQLGSDLVEVLAGEPRAGRPRTRSAGDRHHRSAVGRAGVRRLRPGLRHQLRGVDRSRRRRDQRGRSAAGERPRAAGARDGVPQGLGVARARLDRLCLRRHGERPVRRGRDPGAEHGVRAHQAGGRGGRARGPARLALHRAHRVAVRAQRQQLRQDDAAPGAGARHGVGRRGPDRAAHLLARPGPPDRPIGGEAPGQSGPIHGTNSGEVSWYGFTQEIFRQIGADPARVLPTTSAEFVRPAPRPAYSVLGHDKWRDSGIPEMRDWREAIAAAIADGIAP